MSVFMDLNIISSNDKNRLKSIIETAAHRDCEGLTHSLTNKLTLLEIQ